MTPTRIALACTVLILSSPAVPAADPASAVFTGEYDWSQGGSDELSAEFEPDGDNGRWKVAFRFLFNGRKDTWKGEAEGSLEEGGTIEGTVESDMRGRTWVFRATLEGGVLSGTHAEIRGGGESPSGSFTLKR